MYFLCFSTLKCGHENSSEDTAGSSDGLADGTFFANPTVVATTNKDAHTSTTSTPKQKGHTVTPPGSQCCAAGYLSLKVLSLINISYVDGYNVRPKLPDCSPFKYKEHASLKVVSIVNDLLKTTKPGKGCSRLEFLSFDQDPRICIVRYLFEYLARTKDMRHDHQNLLVSYHKPHRPIFKDS